MGLAKGGLIESRTEIEKASPKGTKAAITALMSTFPYPNDVWADAKTPTSPNRPSFSAFQNGFFVDDFIFTGNALLDEHNGRFCVTPDFPDGIYAYFATIDDSLDSSGHFCVTVFL